MKNLLLLLFICPIGLFAQNCISPEAEALYTKAMEQINSKHIDWINKTSKEVDLGRLKTNDIPTAAGGYGRQMNLQNTDIEFLISLVLFQLSQDTRKDLQSMLEQMQELNEQKKEMRNAVTKLRNHEREQKEMMRAEYDSLRKLMDKSSVPATNKVATNTRLSTLKPAKASLAEIKNLLDYLRDKLDAMNELSESKSLRIQLYMDRMTKMNTTLSNLMKKITETQDAIISNLK